VLLQSTRDLTAYDVRTGEKRWSHAGELSDIPSPSLGDGLIVVHGKDMVALRPSDGGSPPEAIWKAPKLKSAGYPSPAYYRGHFYNVNGASVVTCVDARDGKVVWQSARLKEGPFAASPLAADGKLYLLNEKGTTYVLSLGEKPELLATNELGETALGTPAIADGAIFIRTEKGLYCVGAKK
jgi:outer membrane protein assembly factor BamB